MKKAGVEKKKARRSAGGAAGSGGSDTPPRKQSAEKDVYLSFAEKVRDHKGLESRWAVLQETRVEYFRGKDFVSFLRNHSEVSDILGLDKNLEPEDIGNALLKKNLIVRCDRVVKTLRPGKKKLSTWPAHLEIYPDLLENLFGIDVRVRRLNVFATGIMTACLVLRATVFGALWILLGKRVWIFPNILAEEATLSELFRFWPKKDEEEPPKWTARLFFTVVAVVTILLLRHHAPDEAARARYQKRVSNIIDDVLEWSPKLALSGIMKQADVVNVTDFHNDTVSGSGPSSEVPPPPPLDDVDVDDIQEESEDISEQNHRDESE
ncbi:hypothetical protein KSS87_020409 [Heliosperma pusillum]|nr:hypothetical protein KSS87_020409 [Heliosperma pusillum]